MCTVYINLSDVFRVALIMENKNLRKKLEKKIQKLHNQINYLRL